MGRSQTARRETTGLLLIAPWPPKTFGNMAQADAEAGLR